MILYRIWHFLMAFNTGAYLYKWMHCGDMSVIDYVLLFLNALFGISSLVVECIITRKDGERDGRTD